MFDNTLTIVISHYCIFTEALPRLIPRGFRLLSSLPRLRFSSHRGEFAAITFGKDEVLPRANGPIVSSGTVAIWPHFQSSCKLCHKGLYKFRALVPTLASYRSHFWALIGRFSFNFSLFLKCSSLVLHFR